MNWKATRVCFKATFMKMYRNDKENCIVSAHISVLVRSRMFWTFHSIEEFEHDFLEKECAQM